jgi:hypothetical protein
MEVRGQPRQKLVRPHLKNKLVMGGISVIPATGEVEVGGSQFEAGLGKSSNGSLRKTN